jgi:hypothetical protein
VSSLGAGATVELSFAWTAPSTPATVTLTASHLYTDGNTLNNSLNANVVVEAAFTDLAVTAINAPSTSAPSATHTIGVTVSNVGNQSVAGDITVTLGATGGTVSGSPQTITGGLAPGASATVNFTWTAPATAADGHPDGCAYPPDVNGFERHQYGLGSGVATGRNQPDCDPRRE